MRALLIHYARLFLLRPVLFPGCYGYVYVFRVLGVIMQLYYTKVIIVVTPLVHK
jgi:hypothetical protein